MTENTEKKMNDDATSARVFHVLRQSMRYSCGPAALVSAARLLGKEDYVEAALIAELKTEPVVGTDNPLMARWAQQHLPVWSVGTDTYERGLAIWNIRNALTGTGHFVLVLGSQRGRVRYYDPFWARTLEFPREDIHFISGDERYVRWSINFTSDEDFYDAVLVPDQPYNPEWALASIDRWLMNVSVKDAA